MSTNLSDSDRQFLEKAIFCLKSPPELDIAKMSQILNIKPKSVTNRWCEIKKKLYADLPVEVTTPGGPASGRKRKGKATDTANSVDESSPAGAKTPSKKPRAGRGKKTVQDETAEINAMIKTEDQAEHEASLLASMEEAPGPSTGPEADAV